MHIYFQCCRFLFWFVLLCFVLFCSFIFLCYAPAKTLKYFSSIFPINLFYLSEILFLSISNIFFINYYYYLDLIEGYVLIAIMFACFFFRKQDISRTSGCIQMKPAGMFDPMTSANYLDFGIDRVLDKDSGLFVKFT